MFWIALLTATLAAVFFIVAVVMSNRPNLRRSTIITVLAVVVLVVLGLGIFGAINGSRKFEKEGEHAAQSAPAPDSAGALMVGETR